MSRSRRSPKPANSSRQTIPEPAPSAVEEANGLDAAAPITSPTTRQPGRVTIQPGSRSGLAALAFLSDRAMITLLILVGTIVRLAIAPWGRYLTDSQVMAFRAERLAELPMNQLYFTNQGTISHLPGDLWWLWYISNAFRALSPNGAFTSDTYLYVNKCVPIFFDALAALAIYLIVRDLVGPRRGLFGAALYLFNPAPIVISSLWDQWDSISTCAGLFAVWLFLRRKYEFAAAVLVYAALVKPQFALFGAFFALIYFKRLILPPIVATIRGTAQTSLVRSLAVPISRAVGALFAAWVTAEAVLIPFNVSIPPLSARFDLRDRLDYVFRVHDETTLNAFNLWATPLAGNALEDYELHFLGLTARSWGQALFGVALAIIAYLWWKDGTDRGIVWAGLAMTFASFMLPTRIHERYILPTVALALIVAAIQPRLTWYALALSAVASANLIAVYILAHDKLGAPFFSEHDPWMTLGALINCVLFVWIVARGLNVLRDERPVSTSRQRGTFRRGQFSLR